MPINALTLGLPNGQLFFCQVMTMAYDRSATIGVD